MNRDEKIISIRPLLELADINKKTLELFQNNTLRPILKFQQELTFSLLNNHKNYKPDLANLTKPQYEDYLKKYIQTNLDLKNQLLGVVVGLFTAEEVAYYNTERKELNKRTIQMQQKRFADTVYS